MSTQQATQATHISGHSPGRSGARVCSKHRVIHSHNISTLVPTDGRRSPLLPRVSSHSVVSSAQPRQTTARLSASPAHCVTVLRLTSLLRLTVLEESMSPTDSRFPRSVALMVERAMKDYKQSIVGYGKRKPKHIKWLLPDLNLLELVLIHKTYKRFPRCHSRNVEHRLKLNGRRISMYQLHKFCRGTNTHRIVDVELNPTFIVQFLD